MDELVRLRHTLYAYMVGFVCLHVPAVLLTVWFRGGDLLIPGLISFALSGATLAAWAANRAALSTRLTLAAALIGQVSLLVYALTGIPGRPICTCIISRPSPRWRCSAMGASC